jgi:hypothetical protein
MLDHAAKHAAYLTVAVRELLVLLEREVATGSRKIQGRVRFAILAVAIGQLADKVDKPGDPWPY